MQEFVCTDGTMQRIRAGLFQEHPPGVDDGFADAIYELFNDFKVAYELTEWPRLDIAEKVYHGDSWAGVPPPENQNEPRPSTPVIQSTIENVKADMIDELPKAVIEPEDVADALLSKLLTKVVQQEVEACGYEEQYEQMLDDFLVGGWLAQETGWEADANYGYGASFVRWVSNKNILFDPQCAKLQDGRAVFKIDRKTRDWLQQHYPEQAQYMEKDSMSIEPYHDKKDSRVKPRIEDVYLFVEAWFRVYDPQTRKTAVHMVQLAGRQVLENSALTKPDGYFSHGQYPFDVSVLYAVKGSPLGLGIVDMQYDSQLYSDKLDQILLMNALRASRGRMLVTKGEDIEALRDWSNEILEVSNPKSIEWQQDKALPAYIFNYMLAMRESIKKESGANDPARGETGGITGEASIALTQDVALKRQRMYARRFHSGYKSAITKLIEVIREFCLVPRVVTVTQNGQEISFDVDKHLFRELGGDVLLPLECHVSVQTTRQNRYRTKENNDFVIQLMKMFGDSVDRTILAELMDLPNKEIVLEKLRAASEQGYQAAVNRYNALHEEFQKVVEELRQYKIAYVQIQSSLISGMASVYMDPETTTPRWKEPVPAQPADA